MTTRKVWITADPYGGLTDGEAAAASAAGAGEILHGIPPVLADVIPAGTVGLVEMAEPDLPIPEAVPVEITLADVAAALRDPLADLTPSSASTTVRTAILDQRAALDALLGQLETPLPIPDLPADPDLIPPDPTRLRSPR